MRHASIFEYDKTKVFASSFSWIILETKILFITSNWSSPSVNMLTFSPARHYHWRIQGGAPGTRAPTWSNFFHFHAVFSKNPVGCVPPTAVAVRGVSTRHLPQEQNPLPRDYASPGSRHPHPPEADTTPPPTADTVRSIHPPCGQTHACKHITLPQTFAGGNNRLLTLTRGLAPPFPSGKSWIRR